MGCHVTAAPIIIVKLQCPARTAFSAAESRAAGEELVDLIARKSGAVLPRVVRAYKRLVDQCAAYEARPDKPVPIK